MSKKRDPIVTIVEYFNTAELPLAEQALALAKATVARRKPRASGAKPRPAATKKPLPGPQANVG